MSAFQIINLLLNIAKRMYDCDGKRTTIERILTLYSQYQEHTLTWGYLLSECIAVEQLLLRMAQNSVATDQEREWYLDDATHLAHTCEIQLGRLAELCNPVPESRIEWHDEDPRAMFRGMQEHIASK